MYPSISATVIPCLERAYCSILDESLIRVYALNPLSLDEVTSTCRYAHDTYARDILGCPDSEIEAPELFKIHSPQGVLYEKREDCWQDFIGFLQRTYSDEDYSREPTEFPLAFIILRKPDLSKATLVCFYKLDEQWNVGSCLIPTNAELGMHAQNLKYTEDDFSHFAQQYENDLPKGS